MLDLKQTIVERQEARLATVIVTVRGNTYGSLEVAKLEQLRADLVAARERMLATRDRVIIDLSGITMMGSAFLSELLGWLRTLDRTPADIIVCGDQTGLLKLCATDRWLTVRDDLVAALNESHAGVADGVPHRVNPELACC